MNETALEHLTFEETVSSWVRRDAPPSWIAFGIGGALSWISLFMWFYRVKKLKRRIDSERHWSELLRGMIACAIDNDSPYYTMTSYSAISFLFLGGIQEDYKFTFVVMIIYYCITSFGDSLRVLLAYRNYDSLADVLLFTVMDSELKAKSKEEGKQRGSQELDYVTTEVTPRNVYEDIGRERTIVYMIFFTQVILVTFLCIDIYNTNKYSINGDEYDVGGTLGSYILYILGIFQACVYLLGPKTDFGQSEQNPGFWLIMLLGSKHGARLLWDDPIRDPRNSSNAQDIASTLRDRDGNIITDEDDNLKWYHCYDTSNPAARRTMWRRFFMSYLVNGVAFHILVHALPIQMAAQSTLTSAVIRAVGMMYLVDLDDTKGFTLTITTQPKESGINDNNFYLYDKKKNEKNDDDDDDDSTDEEKGATDSADEKVGSVIDDDKKVQTEADEIIMEAQQKLQDLLKSDDGRIRRRMSKQKSSKKSSTFKSATHIMEFGPIPAQRQLDEALSARSNESKRQ